MMKTLSRLWTTLELMPGLASVLAEWRQLLGDEFDSARPLLRPTDQKASVYPCPSPGGDGCPRQVVDRGESGIVAACGDSQKGCRDIPLQVSDLVVYEVDRQKIGLLATLALGVKPVTLSPMTPLRETFQVGEYTPRAGDRFPVFLTIQPDRERLRNALTRLQRLEPTPCMTLVPTGALVEPDLWEMFLGGKSRILALQDILAVDGRGTLMPSFTATSKVEEFHALVFPDEGKPDATERFPTPPDAHWQDVKIRFLNRDTVSVQCQGIVRTKNYLQMGMADGRSGKPNVQWLFLNKMADDWGRMDIRSVHVSRLNKKRKENLGKELIRYFGIADDPILWDEDASAYITRFILEPER